jgi:hypothetical protein
MIKRELEGTAAGSDISAVELVPDSVAAIMHRRESNISNTSDTSVYEMLSPAAPAIKQSAKKVIVPMLNIQGTLSDTPAAQTGENEEESVTPPRDELSIEVLPLNARTLNLTNSVAESPLKKFINSNDASIRLNSGTIGTPAASSSRKSTKEQRLLADRSGGALSPLSPFGELLDPSIEYFSDEEEEEESPMSYRYTSKAIGLPPKPQETRPAVHRPTAYIKDNTGVAGWKIAQDKGARSFCFEPFSNNIKCSNLKGEKCCSVLWFATKISFSLLDNLCS